MIDGHGDDIFKYGDKIRVNFSTNIPQTVDHSGLMRHLAECSHLLSNYPEPEPRSVEHKLGIKHNISSQNVIVTNGATEAIYLIAALKQGVSSAIVVPTFSEYQDACRLHGHKIEFVIDIGLCHSHDMVWLCNPNNPTGKVFRRSNLLSLIDSLPDTLFVIDQVYADYSVAEVLTVADVVSRPNVIMLQSLTKRFSIPGLRIGYAIAASPIIAELKARRMPWSVNSFAIEASNYLLEHADDYLIDCRSLHREAVRLAGSLQKLGIECSPTDCNFILCRLPARAAAELKDWLVEKYGLLIRDAANFESLDKHYFRIAVQEPGNNDLLIKCIEEWMSL